MSSAQILFAGEVEALAGRVTDAVVTVLDDLGSELTDPGLRVALSALVCAAREKLAHEPVDPAPLVRAVLRRGPDGRRLSAEEEDEFGFALTRSAPVFSTALVVVVPEPVVPEPVAPEPVAPEPVAVTAPGLGRPAPSYWPAVPAISDELFAGSSANREADTDGFDTGLPLTTEPRHPESPWATAHFTTSEADALEGEGQQWGDAALTTEPESHHDTTVFHHRPFGRKRKARQP
ncbi:hypothetical protein [Tessaracoccus sp.]